MKVLNQVKNNLLNREEILVEIESHITPSKQEVAKKLSEKFKKPEENIIIEKVGSKFGSKTFTISAKVYNDIESKDKYETISKKQRKKIAEENKKEFEAKKAAKSSEVKE